MMILSCALCVIAYLMIALFDSAVIGLTGIAISGFAVGITLAGNVQQGGRRDEGRRNGDVCVLGSCRRFGLYERPDICRLDGGEFSVTI